MITLVAIYSHSTYVPMVHLVLEKTSAGGYFLHSLEHDTGRQPGHLRKNGNKKRQISMRENWRAKNSHYYTESHGTIMPMQCYTCPEEEQCFF